MEELDRDREAGRQADDFPESSEELHLVLPLESPESFLKVPMLRLHPSAPHL